MPNNVNRIIYFGAFILGAIIVIGSLVVGGSTDALIVGLFLIGSGWFGGDIETIKEEISAMKAARKRKNKPANPPIEDFRRVNPVNDYQIIEREPRYRSR